MLPERTNQGGARLPQALFFGDLMGVADVENKLVALRRLERAVPAVGLRAMGRGRAPAAKRVEPDKADHRKLGHLAPDPELE